MDQFERLYALHQIFRARRAPVSTRWLKSELDCSRATLQRTLAYMRDVLHAPIRNRPGEGYFYDRATANYEAFELPGTWFRAEEIEALLIMDHLIGRIEPSLLEEPIRPLRKKLREQLEKCFPGRRFPADRIRIIPAHVRRTPERQFSVIVAATVDRRKIAFTYAGRASGRLTQRRASPQRLVYYRAAWYSDCFDEEKQVLRTFSVDRMQSIRLLEAAARRIEDEELDEILTPGYGIFAGTPRAKARLLFTAERAKWVADEIWHPDQEAQYLADGSYELTVPYADPRELAGEILRHGAHVVVLEPDSLAVMVRDELWRAAGRYRGMDSGN